MAGGETQNQSGQSAGGEPLATENPAMPADAPAVAPPGELAAKERAVAIESAEDEESGGVAEQRAYLRREARISEEERKERAEQADIHNTPNVQGRE